VESQALLDAAHGVQHLDTADLAARYKTTPANIHTIHSRSPSRLPPALNLGRRKLLWRLVDVEAWESARVASRPEAPAVAPAPAPRGRKSVAAKARAARAAEEVSTGAES